MTYELQFLPKALKEWKKLNPVVRGQFKKKLESILMNPEVTKNRLSSTLADCYKIKLRQLGYRLVYQVKQHEVVVLVVAVGKRNKGDVYHESQKRLKS